jgi:hypothetical protein
VLRVQARAKELKNELLNSQRLAAFFEEHPTGEGSRGAIAGRGCEGHWSLHNGRLCWMHRYTIQHVKRG